MGAINAYMWSRLTTTPVLAPFNVNRTFDELFCWSEHSPFKCLHSFWLQIEPLALKVMIPLHMQLGHWELPWIRWFANDLLKWFEPNAIITLINLVSMSRWTNGFSTQRNWLPQTYKCASWPSCRFMYLNRVCTHSNRLLDVDCWFNQVLFIASVHWCSFHLFCENATKYAIFYCSLCSWLFQSFKVLLSWNAFLGTF